MSKKKLADCPVGSRISVFCGCIFEVTDTEHEWVTLAKIYECAGTDIADNTCWQFLEERHLANLTLHVDEIIEYDPILDALS